MIAAENLVIGYSDAPVCAPITFSVQPGHALAVVGPNGAGKSTLLRTLVGVLEPLSGDVSVLGAPLDERAVDFRAAVATVFDDDAFFPSLTVAEHLRLVTAGHRVPHAAEVIDGVLETFGIGSLADRFPGSLSSGQRRRFLLASAFARPRSLLILDEPEQRLDLSMRRELAALLVEETSHEGAVILACHDTEMIRTVADTALLIREDGSAAIVTPSEAAAALEE
ncbi:MAG: ABC transporter ATP-binding protein [Ruaniaceae bacterium]|nr:ABC transporter ATP-binding protein [Ruaniaceae bacterium]